MFSELAKESASEMSHDAIFELQTLDLTKCILELTELSDLKLIRKWHNILCKAKTNEHQERNELCALMLEQLRCKGKLCPVFHDEDNEVRSLKTLVEVIKQQTLPEENKVNEKNSAVKKEVEDEKEEKGEAAVAAAVDEEDVELDLLGKITPSRTTFNNIFYPPRTPRGLPGTNEVRQLEYQLHSLQIRFDAQNQTLRLLEQKIKSQEEENIKQKQALEVLMLNIVQHFQNYFATRTGGTKMPLKLFQTNFAHLTKDIQMLMKMKELDRGLERAFNLYAKNLRSSVKHKVEIKNMHSTEKFRHNMLAEIETIANTQLWVQEVRVRAMKQQFLAALRTQLSKLKCERAKVNFNIEKIMKLVDREYKKIFEDIPDA